MDIGTAKATPAEQAEVKHHFIDFQDITQDYSIGDFERDALVLLDKIFEKNDFAVMVGGSGMYIRALCEGLDSFPEVSEEIRENLEKWHQEFGLEYLQNLLKEQDEESYNSLDIQNPNRVKRALGVCLAAEKPFSFYKNQPKQARNFSPIYIALDLPREVLYDRINRRVDAMISEGLENEARLFFPFKEKNALQTVGYQELFEFFEEKISFHKAIELIKKHSRNYAKRQLTWFRNQSNFTFFSPLNVEDIIAYINPSK